MQRKCGNVREARVLTSASMIKEVPMKLKKYSIALLIFPLSSFAFIDPFAYPNYLNILKTALNSVKSLENEATQIQNQLNAIQYQAQNTGTVSDYQYNQISQLMQQMNQINKQGQSISYSASNIDQQFRTQYPNYANQSNNQNYQQSYQNWNNTTLNTINNTMQANGMMASHFQNESQLMDQLRNQGKTATGRMQVLQVSTEIASEDVNQLQELKRITLSQANAQNAYMAYRVSKDSYDEKSLSDIESHTNSQFPAYKNNSQFGLISKGE